MNKTMRILSMAALALVGAVLTSCSSDDDSIADTSQPPVNTSKTVTLTTTVGFDNGGGTRALTAEGVKTFAEGETMVIIYKNMSGETVKTVSRELEAGDISGTGDALNKLATFTFTLDDPDRTKAVKYIYPAAMANSNGSVNYNALSTQDGTLETLASTFDCCTMSGDWDGDALPTGELVNQFAILAINLKNSDGSSSITSDLTNVNIFSPYEGPGGFDYLEYHISPKSGLNTFGTDVIYVAFAPIGNGNIDINATDGTNTYAKSLTGKTYVAGNGYNISWRMDPAIIWNSSNCKDLYIYGPEELYEQTIDGITLTCNSDGGYAYWEDGILFNSEYGGFTFKATSGKNFTKIEVNASDNEMDWCWAAEENLFGDGWPSGEAGRVEIRTIRKVTWRGDATSSVNFLQNATYSFAPVSSIVFYLKD